MKPVYLIFLIVLIFCPLLGAGVGVDSVQAATQQDVVDKSDSGIAYRSKLALLANGQVSGYDIDLSVQNGTVTARGMVDTDLQRQTVLNVLRAVSGVKEVKLDLQVNPAKAGQPTVIRVPSSNAQRDRDLADKVKAALLSDSEFRTSRVDVQVTRGNVQLVGEVKDRATVLRLAQRVRRVPGVVAVNTVAMTATETNTRTPPRAERPAPSSARLSGQQIRDVQRALQMAGLYKGPTDGVWNSLTENALLTFQARYNLPITGQLDAATVSALHVNIPAQGRASMSLSQSMVQGPTARPSQPESFVLVITAKDIGAVQQALQAGGIYRGPITGRLDQATHAALRDFQKLNKLVPSGEIDQATINRLGLTIDLSRKDILQ
ncbi:MAG TPA: peptidoglycan-binding protein [Acidobacteriota bacterium]|jgi:osmotically-inducible protein OsmY